MKLKVIAFDKKFSEDDERKEESYAVVKKLRDRFHYFFVHHSLFLQDIYCSLKPWQSLR